MLEGDIFKTTVLLSDKTGDKTGDKSGDKINDAVYDNTVIYMAEPADKLSKAEKAFLEILLPYLKANGQINGKTAGEITGKSSSWAKEILNKLVEAGILIKTGANKNRAYRLRRGYEGGWP
ncbi:MAG: DUF2207 domain-containing protein [Treponema sp.]|nr:DUF2207 domain-containing protein [Treponema sp.]